MDQIQRSYENYKATRIIIEDSCPKWGDRMQSTGTSIGRYKQKMDRQKPFNDRLEKLDDQFNNELKAILDTNPEAKFWFEFGQDYMEFIRAYRLVLRNYIPHPKKF